MARYFDLARGVVERHGGTVEKFIGDAVMAVFGVPVLHEDDALRAVRAAADLRAGLAGLNESLERDYGTTLELRIGVNTGEVVTGTEERLATGDAVNVAARLEQAARPGEILLGAETEALVRDAVVSAPVDAARAEGQGGRDRGVPARVGVGDGAAPPLRPRRWSAGSASSSACGQRWPRRSPTARASSSPCSAPPASASRASSVEFLDGLDGVTVVRGTCLSYGEGITYWPVVEILKQLLGAEPERRLAELGFDRAAARALQAVLGEGGVQTSGEEIAWATRRLLETEAARAPLVAVLDDIHWGEEAFLDLVDHVADLSRDAPILLLCMARPELLDRRPNWGGGKLNATTVLLEPLAAADAEELVAGLLDGADLDPELRAPDPRRGRGQPALRPGDGRPRPRLAGRRDHRAADDPGAARGPARPARSDRTRRPRARLGRRAGRSIAARCRRSDGRRGRAAHAADGARPPRARPPRPAAVPRRGRLPLPAPADPRCRVRRAAEGDARRAARALRALDRRSTAPTWSSSTRSSDTTSSGPTATGSSSGRAGRRPRSSRPVPPSGWRPPDAAPSTGATCGRAERSSDGQRGCSAPTTPHGSRSCRTSAACSRTRATGTGPEPCCTMR